MNYAMDNLRCRSGSNVSYPLRVGRDSEWDYEDDLGGLEGRVPEDDSAGEGW